MDGHRGDADRSTFGQHQTTNGHLPSSTCNQFSSSPSTFHLLLIPLPSWADASKILSGFFEIPSSVIKVNWLIWVQFLAIQYQFWLVQNWNFDPFPFNLIKFWSIFVDFGQFWSILVIFYSFGGLLFSFWPLKINFDPFPFNLIKFWSFLVIFMQSKLIWLKTRSISFILKPFFVQLKLNLLKFCSISIIFHPFLVFILQFRSFFNHFWSFFCTQSQIDWNSGQFPSFFNHFWSFSCN